MTEKIFDLGDKVAYLSSYNDQFRNGFVLEYIDDSKIGRIADEKDKGSYFITGCADFACSYKDVKESDKYALLYKNKHISVPRMRVLSSGDKRIKQYPSFYQFITTNKINKYFDRDKELYKFFASRNSIVVIRISTGVKLFVHVILGGLVQFCIGDLLNYFKIQHQLFCVNCKIKISTSQTTQPSSPDERKKLEIQRDSLIEQRQQTNRAFLAFIMAFITLIMQLITSVNGHVKDTNSVEQTELTVKVESKAR